MLEWVDRNTNSRRCPQLTVGGHARVETTCRKSGASWRTYTQIVKKKTVCRVQIPTRGNNNMGGNYNWLTT